MLPDSDLRRRSMRSLFRALLPESVAAGGIVDVSAGGAAAALWLPPAVAPSLDGPPDARPEVAEAFEAIARACPPRPFWYLAFLGAAEGGRGHGSAVLSVGLARADAEGVGSALWTGAERNLRFYGRHGYRVLSAHTFPGAAAWWLWRDPS